MVRRLLQVVFLLVLTGPVGRAIAEAPPLAFEIVAHDTPLIAWANRVQTVHMRIRNTGTLPWSPTTDDHLSYHWLDPQGDQPPIEGVRTVLPATVRPGEEIEVDARLQGPEKPGVWLLRWAMVREQVSWYWPQAPVDDARLAVRVFRLAGLRQLAFALVTLVLALAASRWLAASPGWRWWIMTLGPPLWTWVAIILTCTTFAELLGPNLDPSLSGPLASGAAILALPTALLPTRWRVWAAAGIAVLAVVVLTGDLLYVRFFGSIVPLSALAATGQAGQVEGSITALFKAPDAWLLLVAVDAAGLLAFWPRWRVVRPPRPRARRLLAIGGALVGVLASVPAVGLVAAGLRNPSLSKQVFSYGFLLNRWSALNVHYFDLMRTAKEWLQAEPLSDEDRRKVEEFFRLQAAAAPSSGPLFGAAHGANLVLIQVESLQHWVIGAEIHGVPVTPFLNSLRSRALYFSNMFDQSAQGRSSDGEFAALNSQHPLSEGAVVFRRAQNRFVALPGVLRDRGYATLSAHAFHRGFWNRGLVHPRYGFERMLFRDELGAGEYIGWGLADGVFFERVAPRLAELPQSFFAFLITLGLHHPFEQFPNRHMTLDAGALAGTPLGNYLHAMHYFDACLRDLIAALERSGTLRNTVVALYGDHDSGLEPTPELLELAGAGPMGATTFPLLLRVPFLVMLPGGTLAGEVPTPGGHIDIAPTLLYLLGERRPACFAGVSLLPNRSASTVIRWGAASDSLVWASQGHLIPEGGACFSLPSGKSLPRADCALLARQADEKLTASRLLVMHDLAAELCGQ
ncbi:MAG: sulfatase-like hydrolase/transferase [Acidobacteriota bacterium]